MARVKSMKQLLTKNKEIMKYLAAFLMIVGLSFGVQAQAKKLNIKNTKVSQQVRINQGIKSGELTKRETVKLTKQQHNINQTIARSKADGVITKKERAIINGKQIKADNKIYRLKHN